MSADLLIQKTATLSDCGTYRYRLTRQWADGPLLPFVMLNPSTADADVDDPTIRRCMAFARRECAAGIVVGNLFAFRATKPSALFASEQRVGPHNEHALYEIVKDSVVDGMPIVCAWGAHGAACSPHFWVESARCHGATLRCLGKTSAGHPRHPLYVRGDQPLEPFPSPLPVIEGS